MTTSVGNSKWVNVYGLKTIIYVIKVIYLRIGLQIQYAHSHNILLNMIQKLGSKNVYDKKIPKICSLKCTMEF